MPGIIEDGDLRDDRAHAGEVRFAVSAEVVATDEPVPPIDVERVTDGLRLMGVDVAVVREFEARAALDIHGALEWLESQLEDPAEWVCDCGEALVDDTWRGRAIVRCSECGARWGLDVTDERAGRQWMLDGPTARWRADHDDDPAPSDSFPPEEVLEVGLPPMPDGIAPGERFPLAVWQDGRDALVLYVHRSRSRQSRHSGDDEYEHEIEQLRRGDAGQWIETGGSGGNWINPFAAPEDLVDKYVVIGTGVDVDADEDVTLQSTGGFCSKRVAALEIEEHGDTRRQPIDPMRRTFVVGTTAPFARLRFIDGEGNAMHGLDGTLLEIALERD